LASPSVPDPASPPLQFICDSILLTALSVDNQPLSNIKISKIIGNARSIEVNEHDTTKYSVCVVDEKGDIHHVEVDAVIAADGCQST